LALLGPLFWDVHYKIAFPLCGVTIITRGHSRSLTGSFKAMKTARAMQLAIIAAL
jgi:hypothetical protein